MIEGGKQIEAPMGGISNVDQDQRLGDRGQHRVGFLAWAYRERAIGGSR